MNAKTKILLTLVALALSMAALWYGAQYLRTGQFWAYIKPPSFRESPPDPVFFIADLHSYATVKATSGQLEQKGYGLTPKEKSNYGEFKGRKFNVESFEIPKFRLADKDFKLSLVFFNDRLAQVYVCSEQGVPLLLQIVNTELGLNLKMQSSITNGHVRIQYIGSDGDCVLMDELRLEQEYQLWNALTS